MRWPQDLVLLLQVGIVNALRPTEIIVINVFGSLGGISLILIVALVCSYTIQKCKDGRRRGENALTEVVSDGRRPYTSTLKNVGAGEETSLATVSSLSEDAANSKLQQENAPNHQPVSKSHESSRSQTPDIADNYSKDDTLVFEEENTSEGTENGKCNHYERPDDTLLEKEHVQNERVQNNEQQILSVSPLFSSDVTNLQLEHEKALQTAPQSNGTPPKARNNLHHSADLNLNLVDSDTDSSDEEDFTQNIPQETNNLQQLQDSLVLENLHYKDPEPQDNKPEVKPAESNPGNQPNEPHELEKTHDKFPETIHEKKHNEHDDTLPTGSVVDAHEERENRPAEQEPTKLSSEEETDLGFSKVHVDKSEHENQHDGDMITVTEVHVQTEQSDLLMSEYLQTSSEPPNRVDNLQEGDSIYNEDNTEEQETVQNVGENQDEHVAAISTLQVPDGSAKPDMDTDVVEPSKKRDEIVFTSGWGKLVKLLDLFKSGLVSEDTVKKLEHGEIEQRKVASDLGQYLKGEEPIGGLLLDNGDVMSLFEASNKGIIRRGTAISLLEAQAATGSIINPLNGDKMNVTEATRCNLIGGQFESVLIRAERAVLGFRTKFSDKPFSLFEAMQRGLVAESRGVRLLEAQIATGGVIDPHANHRLSIDVAFERGLFDQRLHDLLSSPDKKGFYDPNTNENLTYLELMQRCTFAADTGLRLLPFKQRKARR